MLKRTIVVGDIHGCIDELKELLNKISYNKNNDRLILLGDLIDRGPNSVGTVEFARKNNIESVLGNHEFKLLKWYSSNNKFNLNYKHLHYKDYSIEDIQYIQKMKNYIYLEDQNTVIVHAGLKCGISLENQKQQDLIYLRYTDKSGNKLISSKVVKKLGKEVAGAYFWTDFWKGPYSVIYGHYVSSLTTPFIEKINENVMCYGLDTGCCFGGSLTAMIVETKEIIQVKSKKEYYNL